MKNIANSIKLNQATVEKWMMSQAVEELLEMCVSMSKGTVTEVVKNTPRQFIWNTVKKIRGSVMFPRPEKLMFGNSQYRVIKISALPTIFLGFLK